MNQIRFITVQSTHTHMRMHAHTLMYTHYHFMGLYIIAHNLFNASFLKLTSNNSCNKININYNYQYKKNTVYKKTHYNHKLQFRVIIIMYNT